MAVSAAYTVSRLVDAFSHADTYVLTAAYTGIYEAVDTVLDAELALDKAKLSPQQEQIAELSWKQGFTQEEVGSILGITQQSVFVQERRAKEKIAGVIKEWGAADAI